MPSQVYQLAAEKEPMSVITIIPDTPFPYLDTIYRTSNTPRSRIDTGYSDAIRRLSKFSWRNIEVQIADSALRLGQSTIYEAYAIFVAAFVGRDEVAFHIRAFDKPSNVIVARVEAVESSLDKCVSWNLVENSKDDASVDFGLDIRGTNEAPEAQNSSLYNTSCTLSITMEADCSVSRIAMRVRDDLLSESNLSQIFNTILSQLKSSSAQDLAHFVEFPSISLEKSILNFPSLTRPPVLKEDGDEHKALLHGPFERRAQSYPDRIALDFLESQDNLPNIRRVFTYGQINDLANALAKHILANIDSSNIRTSSVVPMLLPTSPELYISYLAVLKAGLAFCPLPTEAPGQRIQDIVKDLKPQVILGSTSFQHLLGSFKDFDTEQDSELQPWIDVEDFVRTCQEDASNNHSLPLDPSEDDVAYVMYTSGSTGKPKGVQITHLASSSSIASHALISPLPAGAAGIPRWFQFAAPTFDPSLMEIFVTLSSGATLCSASRSLTLTDLEATVSELGATVMMSTPSMAALIRRERLPTLRSLWTMGETLLRKNIDDFASLESASNLCNAYGPTEASINCTLLPKFHPEDRGSIIGPALPTCSLFIIDPDSRIPTPIPRGLAGELAIGGPQVSIGYLNRPEQNLKSFVESPIFGRLYRTGDKARIVTDREGKYVVEFLGRLDNSQVKLSGRRVELGEIDSIIVKCRGVKESVTVSHKRFADQYGSEEAITFVTLHDGFDRIETEATCREAASLQLPSYMCPSRYICLEQIPRSLAGKVDRKALSAIATRIWYDEDMKSNVSSIAPNSESLDGSITESDDKTTIEDLLCGALARAMSLKHSCITTNTNFFSVGVDSLRAIRYLQHVRDLGVTELTIVDILRGATPHSLARLIEERRSRFTANPENGNTIRDDLCLQQSKTSFNRDEFFGKYKSQCMIHFGNNSKDIDGILPTTATQSGMLASLLRSSAKKECTKNYIHHSVHYVNADINISRLQDSWITVLNRHEAYRIVFLPIDDNVSPFLQCILSKSNPRATKSWKEQICETGDQITFDSAIKVALEVAERNITIDRPPVELTLVSSPNRVAIIFSIFHAIFDGASLQLLFDEITLEYHNQEIPQRTDISTSVDMHFNSDFKGAIDFWSSQLEACDPVPFPCLTGFRPDIVTKTPRTTTILAALTLTELREGAKRSLSSPLATLQAAWSLLLATYKDSISGSTFGSVISGRLDQATENCMGPTFTTIPVTIPGYMLESDKLITNSSVTQKLTKLNAHSLQHLQIPLNTIVTPSGSLYYDTLLAFQDFATVSNNSDLWHKVDYPAMGNDFAVMIEIWPEASGALRLRATYTDEHLDYASASLMLKQFSDIISFVTKNPERLFLDGRHGTVSSFAPLAGYPSSLTGYDQLLHGTFERNAILNPDDIALIFKRSLCSPEGSTVLLSYKELNDRANQFASYLIRYFGPLNDTVVPFCLEKSPELYVAVLGILKAGAAWCPIDPAFPVDRRHDLIARTDTKLLIVADTTATQDTEAVPKGVVLLDLNDPKITSLPVPTTLEMASLVTVNPQDMAYLIWTSGTTGLPKGVQVQHNSAATSMQSLAQLIDPNKEGTVRCLQFSQPTFDVFVQDLFYTWYLRGVVISATKDIMLGSFAALANQTSATHAHLTPAFATIIPRNTIKTLEVITMIGEALPQAIADDWGYNMKAYNTYGPAEVSVVSTVRLFSGPNKFKSTNIGFTLPSVSAYILDSKSGKPTMKHGVGELVLSGPQVARGYWKDISKTQEKFLWNEHVGAHIYFTGDIVRQLHDGSFEFVGRRDDLIKLAGMRVELSEISFALATCHDNVEQVVTMHINRLDRPKKVVVVFLSVPCLDASVTKTFSPITNDLAVEIANAANFKARRTLPDHMIPSVFIILSSIPVTASAKVDRKALVNAYHLLDLELWEGKISPAQSSEWTEKETLLVNHIAEFSSTNPTSIGRTSRLAALGIDSIGAIRLTARLKSTGYDVSSMSLLQSRTVGDLCALLDTSSEVVSKLQQGNQILEDFHKEWLPKVSKHLKDSSISPFTVCPALPIQENLLSETFRNYEAYWSNHFFELANEINIYRLKKAWTKVASDNEALRVGYVATVAVTPHSEQTSQSTLLQLISDNPRVQWKEIEVSSTDYVVAAKSRSKEIALRAQQNTFLEPCWAVTIFDIEKSRKVMMFTVHHSIHDGPSLEFIIDDLSIAYLGSSASKTRHQLREAVAMSMSSISNTAEDELFWEDTLKGFTIVDNEVPAPTFSQRERKSYNTVTVELSTPLAEVQNLAHKYDLSSVTAIFRAAWSCTVADFLELSSNNILLGEVLSERLGDSSLEDMVGPLVSFIPSPATITGNIQEIIRLHDQITTRVWKHRNVAPGTIRKLINSPKHLPLYPAVFVFHPYSASSHDNSSLWTQTEDIIGLNVEHDLALNVEQQSDGSLQLVLSAEASTLGITGAKLLAKQLDSLISAMILHPDQSIAELTDYFPQELISITEHRKMNFDTIVDFNNPLCWFEHHASMHPSWPAAEIAESIGAGETKTAVWTYKDLNGEAEKIAAFIESHEVRGRMIGMSLGRTLAAFAVTLGIFKSGNTYLPIDEDLPQERKSFLLRDSNAAMFFTVGAVEFAPPGCEVFDINHNNYTLDRTTPTNVVKRSSDVAYLLYTSGSTGNPKGVLISNANLTSFCEAQSEFICTHVPVTSELGGVGKYMCLASRAFDVHVGEMFLAWRHGLCAVTGKRSLLLDDLPLALKELEVTHASFVPSLLDQVGLVPSDVPLLKFMGVGGEKISQRTLETFGDSKTVALVNAYGPTEATIGCCSASVNSKSNMRNIGRPLGDTVAHVLLPGTLTYAKRGMEGELCLTGSLVGIGYHNRDTGAFVEDFNGEKMYRTGDLVRLMPDDTIEIFGRSDDQTKIRGQRLELGEVSECVRVLAGEGTDVTSFITKHPELSRMQLVSFVASSKSTAKDEISVLLDNLEEVNEKLRAGCKEILPAYMVPDLVIPISFLPLASMSGKADVKLLKAIFASIPLNKLISNVNHNTPSSGPVVADRALTDDEQEVAEMLKRVIRGDGLEIKASTNIFEVGVDSLVAISLSTLMRNAGYECSVADVLGLATVEDLAALRHTSTSADSTVARLEAARKEIAKVEALFRVSPVCREFVGNIEAVRPCLHVQEAVVARSVDNDGTSSYVNHIILELSQNADLEKLQIAWMDTVRYNQILRTCFCHFENDIVQVILRSEVCGLSWKETPSSDGIITLRSMQDSISKDILEHIGTIPPFRINIVLPKSNGHRTMLCLSIHHALYDAESLTILMDEIYSRYNSLDLPDRPSSGALVEHIASIEEIDARRYWTKMLHDHSVPASSHLEKAISNKSQVVDRVLKTSLSSLETLASRLRITLPSLAQTVFGLAMAKFTSVNDFIFGLVLSGRSVPVSGIENLLAPSITTVPQRFDLRNSHANIFDILSTIQKSSGDINRFQHTSLRAIHKWVEADRPLFDSLLSYIKPTELRKHGDLWTELESYMPPDYPFAVEFEANTQRNHLIIHAGYKPAFGSSSEIESLLEMMELLIDTIYEGNNVSVKSLGISAKQEREINTRSEDSQDFSEQEIKIKDVLCALGDISTELISRHSTFFRLGIDSVIAIRFARQLRNIGLEVSSSDVARYPTIALLSAHIDRNRSIILEEKPHSKPWDLFEQHQANIPLLTAEDRIVEIYPCTPLQTGLLTQTIATDGMLYVHHPTVLLATDVDLERLKEAWEKVIASLDILRVSFHYLEASDSIWIAAVHSEPGPRWLEIEIGEDVNTSIRNIVETTIFSSPDSFSAPPVKATVSKSRSVTTLTISLHHSLYDGWSLPLIFEALLATYCEVKPSLREPFSKAASLIAKSQESSIDFWGKQLKGYSSIELPYTEKQGSVSFSKIVIGMKASEALQRCKLMNINLQAAALLAYGKALCCLVKRRDVVFGLVVSGRTLPIHNVESIVGPLFNTVAFRVKLDNPLLSNDNLATQVQKNVTESHEFEHASLKSVQNLWRQMNETDASLIDSLFVFQKVSEAETIDGHALWKPFDMVDDRNSTEYSLNVELQQGPQDLILSAASPRLRSKDIDAFCKSFDAIFNDILSSPSRSVTAFPALLHDLPLVIDKNPIHSSIDDFSDLVNDPSLPIIRDALAEVTSILAHTIQIGTSIWSIGTDSIAAIRVASICRRQGLKISVADVLQGRCIGGIIRLIAEKKEPVLQNRGVLVDVSTVVKNSIISQLRLPESSIEQIFPCLAGQVYHLASWLKSGRTCYEPTWSFVSSQKIDATRLEKSWRTLQLRHPILRTIFATAGSREAYQIVLKREVVDGLASTFKLIQARCSLEEAVKHEVKTSATHPADLFMPPINLCLILGETEDSVLIKLHHSLYDAWTMTSLVNELSAIYLNQEQQTLPPPDFSNFVWHTQNALHSTNEVSYWKTALSTGQPTIIPPRSSLPMHPPLKQTFIWVRRAVCNFSAITELCKAAGVACSTVIVLAFSRALATYVRTKNPIFGFFQAGRAADFPDMERIPGPCVNLLPFVVPEVDKEKRDIEAMKAIQEELGRRVPFEQSHLRDVLACYQGPDSNAESPAPIFNANLNLLFHYPSTTPLAAESSSCPSKQDPLLKPLDIGVPTDFASEHPLSGETAIDGLDIEYLSQNGLFVDVGPVVETDSIDFGVKVDAVLMDEGDVRSFIDLFVEDIGRILADLII